MIDERVAAVYHLARSEHPDVVAFWAALERLPDDRVTLLAFSDRLEELATPGWHDLAFALRWMAGAGRHPVKRTEVRRHPWTWVRAGASSRLAARLARSRPACGLPRPVFLSHPDRQWADASEVMLTGHRFAAAWLACGLIPLRELLLLGDHLPTVR